MRRVQRYISPRFPPRRINVRVRRRKGTMAMICRSHYVKKKEIMTCQKKRLLRAQVTVRIRHVCGFRESLKKDTKNKNETTVGFCAIYQFNPATRNPLASFNPRVMDPQQFIIFIMRPTQCCKNTFYTLKLSLEILSRL